MRQVDEAIAHFTHFFLCKSGKEWRDLSERMEKIAESPEKRQMTITLKVSLNDTQTRMFECLQALLGKTEQDVLKQALLDGIRLDTTILCSAMEMASQLRESGYHDDGEED